MNLTGKSARWTSIVVTSVLAFLATTGTAAAATADVSVSMAASGGVTYTATISNGGPDMATNVSFTASLPGGIIPILVTPEPGCAFNFEGTMVACSLGGLASGASTTVTIEVHAITTGTKTATGTVSASETDPNPADNSASASVSLTGVGLTEMQVILYDAPDPIHVGQGLYYIAAVTNIQDDTAQNVVAEITIPTGTVLVGAVSTRGACTASGRRISCPLGAMNPSETAHAIALVVPTTSGYIWATAAVSVTTPDANPNNNSSSARTWVNP
jgi:uncharacterized repeat protein (TIGR01451 family)